MRGEALTPPAHPSATQHRRSHKTVFKILWSIGRERNDFLEVAFLKILIFFQPSRQGSIRFSFFFAHWDRRNVFDHRYFFKCLCMLLLQNLITKWWVLTSGIVFRNGLIDFLRSYTKSATFCKDMSHRTTWPSQQTVDLSAKFPLGFFKIVCC